MDRRYLTDDLRLSCESDEYGATRDVAFLCVAIWPLGIPLLYALLLWARRHALRADFTTTLSRATDFLWQDYHFHAFMWEPLEMCRKLALGICACGN